MNFRSTFSLLCLPVFFSLVAFNCAQKNQPLKESTTPMQKELQSLLEKGEKSTPDTLPPPEEYIKVVNGLDSLNALIDSSTGKLLVFDLYADWCMPCKLLAPLYDSLASAHGEKAAFFRVDVQRNQEIAAAFNVQGIPMVLFIKDKEVVHASMGLNNREHYEKVLVACSEATSVAECKEKLKNIL